MQERGDMNLAQRLLYIRTRLTHHYQRPDKKPLPMTGRLRRAAAFNTICPRCPSRWCSALEELHKICWTKRSSTNDEGSASLDGRNQHQHKCKAVASTLVMQSMAQELCTTAAQVFWGNSHELWICTHALTAVCSWAFEIADPIKRINSNWEAALVVAKD